MCGSETERKKEGSQKEVKAHILEFRFLVGFSEGSGNKHAKVEI